MDANKRILSLKSAIPNTYTSATCASVGSAQQYQGSSRYGIVARGISSKFSESTSPQLGKSPGKSALRGADSFCALSTSRNTRRPSDPLPDPRCTHGYTSDFGSKRPTSADFVQLQQARARSHQQPQRELNRRDVLHQIEFGERAQQIAISFDRGPGRERDKRRLKRQIPLRASAPTASKKSLRVWFFSSFERPRSSTDSTALVINKHPVSRRRRADRDVSADARF